MADETHDLELTILGTDRSAVWFLGWRWMIKGQRAYLEAFILENLLDGNLLFFLGHVEETSGKDDTKRAIANDLAVGILDLLCLARLAIASDDLYYFIWVV